MYVLRCFKMYLHFCHFGTGSFPTGKINPSLALSGILHGVTFVLNISNLFIAIDVSMSNRWSPIGWIRWRYENDMFCVFYLCKNMILMFFSISLC